MISVHVEVLPHLHRTVQALKALGVKAGVVLNPGTPVDAIEEIAADLDYVLVMSVNPGFGGQTFIPRSESKVRDVRALLDAAGNEAPVEIDGGIDLHNVGRVVAAGARMIVAGSAVFNTPDPERAVRELKAAALSAVPPVAVPR
jgi:ribulose-phosphate 3-epimerase